MKVNRNLTPSLYLAMGQLCCEWAALEGVLQLYVQRVTALDAGICLKFTFRMSGRELMDLVRRLLHVPSVEDVKQPELLQRLDGMQGEFDELVEVRNRAVHTDWSRGKHGWVVGWEARAKGKKLVRVSMHVQHLGKVVQRIRAFTESLRALLPP